MKLKQTRVHISKYFDIILYIVERRGRGAPGEEPHENEHEGHVGEPHCQETAQTPE
jgi:hypothetical protein